MKRKYKNSRGRGWHNDHQRHQMSAYGFKNTIDNKVNYENRFERKVKKQIEQGFDIDELTEKIDDINTLKMENGDMVDKTQDELLDDLKPVTDEYKDIKKSMTWLYENGYIKGSFNYSMIMNDFEQIKKDFDNYLGLDLLGMLKSHLERLKSDIQSLDITRDKEERRRNIKKLQRKKEERKREKERMKRQQKILETRKNE